MNALSYKELIELKSKNHVVMVYPRKRRVCIDGFKHFRVSEVTIRKFKGDKS